MYDSRDTFDFDAALADAVSRRRAFERTREKAQAASELKYTDDFATNSFHPSNHGDVTFGLGFARDYADDPIELTPGQVRTHRRKAKIRRAVPPTRRVAPARTESAQGLS